MFDTPGARTLRAASLAALAAAAAFCASGAAAQDWPQRTVTMVVPFAAGGTTDILARIVAQGLSTELGQSVIVENQPGAGGSLGTAAVARADPDGYTLLLGTIGTHAINASLYPNVGYDPVADFAPVTPVAILPNVLVANPAEPYDTVEELVAYAREHPGEVLFASSGSGSTIHLSGELFKVIADVDIEHVPYTGSGPAVTALMGHEINIMFDNLPSSIEQIRNGSLKALAMTSAERSDALPDVPTIAESGYPEYETSPWFGLFAPAGTPDAVLERLHEATVELLGQDAIRARLAQQGATAYTLTPAEFAGVIEADTAKWAQIIEAADVRVD